MRKQPVDIGGQKRGRRPPLFLKTETRPQRSQICDLHVCIYETTSRVRDRVSPGGHVPRVPLSVPLSVPRSRSRLPKRLAAILIAIATITVAHPQPVDAAGRCPQWEHLLRRHSPGWSVARMSGIMWRESRCQPAVTSRTNDHGLLQINRINFPYLTKKMRMPVNAQTLKNPTVNIRAAALLYRYWHNTYRAWATR